MRKGVLRRQMGFSCWRELSSFCSVLGNLTRSGEICLLARCRGEPWTVVIVDAIGYQCYRDDLIAWSSLPVFVSVITRWILRVTNSHEYRAPCNIYTSTFAKFRNLISPIRALFVEICVERCATRESINLSLKCNFETFAAKFTSVWINEGLFIHLFIGKSSRKENDDNNENVCVKET